jgi:hypothetical protein
MMVRDIKILSINFLNFAHSRNPKYDIIRNDVSPEKEER